MGACGNKQAPPQPHQQPMEHQVEQSVMQGGITILSEPLSDTKKIATNIMPPEPQAGEQSGAPCGDCQDNQKAALEHEGPTAVDEAEVDGTAVDDAPDGRNAQAERKPDFTGRWKMVRFEGDMDTWMREAGVGWALRKLASSAGFGVNSTFHTIKSSEESVTIETVNIKGSITSEYKIDGSVQTDTDGVHKKSIKVVPFWEDVAGRTTLTVDASTPAQQDKSAVSASLTRRFFEGDSMVVEKTSPNGTVIRVFFEQES